MNDEVDKKDQEGKEQKSEDTSNVTKIRREKVLVGMTGRMDSTVTAYLLKMQGYEVIGMAINLFNVNNNVFNGKRYVSGPEGNLIDKEDTNPYIEKIIPHCHIQNLDLVKKICDSMEIGFYGGNAYEEYREGVLGNVFSSRIAGDHFFPCGKCSEIVIRFLAEKAAILDINKIATGHYTKVQYNKTSQLYQILVAP